MMEVACIFGHLVEVQYAFDRGCQQSIHRLAIRWKHIDEPT